MPRWQVPLNGTTVAVDLVASDGVARQRRGWAEIGEKTSASTSAVWRAQFALAGVTRTMLNEFGNQLSFHVTGDTFTEVGSLTSTSIPRAVYRDQIVYCAQDGTTPIQLYSGGSIAADATQTVTTITGSARITLGAAVTGTVGSYVVIPPTGAEYAPIIRPRVLEVTSTTNWTLEGIKSSSGTAHGAGLQSNVGRAYPCVPIYSASTGDLSAGGNTFTGDGTRFSQAGVTVSDGLLVLPSGASARLYYISTVTSDTVLGVVNNTDLSDTNYQILRACPFKDVAVNNESLYGTGVAQYPNRVYIGPPGWNPAFPPGFAEPFDPDTLPTSDDPSEFRMFEVDVPAPYDGDHNVALLPVENGVLVLKRFAVHIIRGSYPNFAQQKVTDGGGCIDIRSAVTTKAGPFWAGYDGVFTYQGGQVINLMEGRVADEWRAYLSTVTTPDYIAVGEAEDHLLVSVITDVVGGAPVNRTYVFDLNNKTWISRFSNTPAHFFWSGRDVPDNPPQCLFVTPATAKKGVYNAQPMFVTTGDERDADLTEPALSFTTGTGITRAPLDQEVRVVDASFTVNVQDSGAAGSTVVTPAVVHGGGLRQGTSDQTKTLTNIESDTVDRIDRVQYTVGRTGREFYITVTANGSSTTQKVEVHQIALTVRDVGRNRR